MKLTPEQKAFYEYGKARTDLNCKIKEIRNNARIRFRMEYCELPLSSRAEILNLFGFEGFIDKVRQKRAACRIKCGQCVHFSIDEWGPRKDGCLKRSCWVKSDRCAIGCRYWEPRKEDSND